MALDNSSSPRWTALGAGAAAVDCVGGTASCRSCEFARPKDVVVDVETSVPKEAGEPNEIAEDDGAPNVGALANALKAVEESCSVGMSIFPVNSNMVETSPARIGIARVGSGKAGSI